MKIHLAIIMGSLALVGCGQSEQMMAYDGQGSRMGAIDGSIFPADTQMASNDDVIQVLEGKVPMKEGGNLALLSIGGMHFLDAGYTEKITSQIHNDFKDNKFVGDVINVPRMLMPNKISVSNIREMGARLQCENVLVFTAYNDTRYEKNTFTKDEMRVNLTVEGVLVNVRTGCIPVALSVDKELVIKEQEYDFDRYEFNRRGQRECFSNGLKDICSRINHVLSQVK